EYEAPLVASDRSEFQQIDIYDHPSFGMMLVLDGLVQTTVRDEFVYHEMLAHVPLVSLPSPERILIIGGGDGGTLRHVLMHPTVKRAVMVEIDERVTELCRKFMPSIAGDAFDDARADVIFGDGIGYVKTTKETFDAILIDSSDPVGPGEGLFTPDFYRAALSRLDPGGVLAAQSGSPYAQQDELHRAYRNATTAFADVRPYAFSVPTYPGTLWSFLLCGERLSIDGVSARERALARGLITKYWTPDVQRGCFDVPKIVRDVIAPEGPPHTWGLSPGERDRRAIP
ncbi:MAG: polyamine aminopropyltransferase, partial [Actinobacteria bacterium]|nr:polyamine aminopropyltransferase [Actinomycetota bacterium]